MTELCQQYEIVRETGYVWLRRYRHAGAAGLIEHRRAAHRHGNQTPEDLEPMVLELRQAHMRWGPRKLKWVLQRDEPGRSWPAASTIGTAEAGGSGGGAQEALAHGAVHRAVGAHR